MKIEQVGHKNAHVITTDDGWQFLFSYRTLVAMRDQEGNGYRTTTWYSRTTTKHINGFVGPDPTDMCGNSLEIMALRTLGQDVYGRACRGELWREGPTMYGYGLPVALRKGAA